MLDRDTYRECRSDRFWKAEAPTKDRGLSYRCLEGQQERGGGYIYSLCKDGTIFWIVLYWSLTGITLNFMCVFLLRGKAAHGAKDKSELLVCCSLVLHGSQQGVVMEGPFRYWVNVVAVKPTGRRKTRNTWSWYTVCTSKKQTRPDVNIQRVQY